MALSFSRLSWLWLKGKDKEQVSNGSVMNSKNSLGERGLGLRGEAENLKFYSMKSGDGRMRPSSSSRKLKRKWNSREERSRRIDKECDVVLVPSDGVGLSGSESENSDWSIGWMEPHAPGFNTDDERDDSFAVLVPLATAMIRRISRRRRRISSFNSWELLRIFQMANVLVVVNTWNSGFPLFKIPELPA